MTRWVPAIVLSIGIALLELQPSPTATPLRAPLPTVPKALLGLDGQDVPISEAEVRAAGTMAHLLRVYGDSLRSAFSVYVGYYAGQSHENQLHSPRNCLPGAGWEILSAGTETVGRATVNRYLVGLRGKKAVVYYWYQGRGRITHQEFKVKMNLLADAVRFGRTEEALVRVVIPVESDPQSAPGDAAIRTSSERGREVVASLLPVLERILPSAPGSAPEGGRIMRTAAAMVPRW